MPINDFPLNILSPRRGLLSLSDVSSNALPEHTNLTACSDPDRAYHQLLDEINLLEREPQWVPAAWLRKEPSHSFY
jgi:hypothetical protein